MTVLHLSHAADASDGGIATAVNDLIAAQRAAGLEVDWLTSDRFKGFHRDQNLLGAVKVAHPSLLHLHGLWRSPTRIASRLADSSHPLVVAPHGMLDPWALVHSRWKKRLAWSLFERRALRSARCIHVLCPAEAAVTDALDLGRPIAVIPNGVSMPVTVAAGPPPWENTIPAGASVLLYLGRFHAKKGLVPLLKAWQAVAEEAERHGWWLALVGYGDGGALAEQVSAAKARGELARVSLHGPCFDEQKHACFTAAKAFVLPSYSEGLPMAALEAMAYHLPSLLSTACNIPEAFSLGASLPAEPEDHVILAKSLHHLFELSEAEAAAMGSAGHALVAQGYSWPRVAEQTRQLYDWVLGYAERPGFVEG